MKILFGSNKALRRRSSTTLVICVVCSLPFITTTNRFLSYNNLLPETSLPIDENEKVHWVHLLKMIRDCNASDKFGVIALHQHKTLLPNHSFVWNLEQVNKSYFYWT